MIDNIKMLINENFFRNIDVVIVAGLILSRFVLHAIVICFGWKESKVTL